MMPPWWQIYKHVWKEGHSIEVKKYMSTLALRDGARGWLYKCSCGETWSR